MYCPHQQLSGDIANKIPQYQVLDLEINPIIVLNDCCHQAVMDFLLLKEACIILAQFLFCLEKDL
jgi:hypothetical protein